MLLGIVKMILETSEGGIGRWKLTEVEEHFFGEDCNVACMNKQDCENEGALTILQRIQHTLY